MAIFKKGRKWWIGYRTSGGKWRRESVGYSHALAREVLAKRLAEAAERKHFPARVANASSFAEIIGKFWSLHGQYMRSKSWKCMLKDIRAHFGPIKAGEIKTAEVQRYHNQTAARTSNSTANRHLTLLKSIFNKAITWNDFYGNNPCNGVKKQREPVHRLRYLSLEEMDRLLSAANPRLYPVLTCALLTGMRKGEILGLFWENIDLERNIIYILKSKSGKSREIPIAAKLREVLLHLGPGKCGPVFELPEIMLRRYFAKALADAQIFGFRFHDLRHTFASHFIMRTNDLPALQNLLGHHSPIMTQRYAHLSREHLVSEMALFESGMPIKALNAPLPLHKYSTAPTEGVSQGA